MPLPIPPIDPSIASEFQVGPLESPATVSGAGGADFGGALTKAIDGLQGMQENAATASQALATGTASDPESVVMAVERARLAMQLASQLRTKAVEAAQDIFHTQV